MLLKSEDQRHSGLDQRLFIKSLHSISRWQICSYSKKIETSVLPSMITALLDFIALTF